MARSMAAGFPVRLEEVGVFADGVAVQAYSNILHSRYESNLTDSSNNKDAKNGAYPGVPNTRDQFTYIKHHGVPPNYASSGMWYGSPPDVWGRGTVVLDVGGQPIMANAAWNTEMVDSPYEMSLSGQTKVAGADRCSQA
jgi:hypothetical protein